MAKGRRLFRGGDLVRILFGFEIETDLDAQQVALVLLRCEWLIEKHAGLEQFGMDLMSRHPHWMQFLEELARTKWATEFRNKYPIRAAEIETSMTLWRQTASALDLKDAASVATP